MTATTLLTYAGPPVVGDGTTARDRARRRWRRARWPLVVLTALLVTAAVAAVVRPTTSADPLAPDNPGPEGARAVARVLEREGVDVRHVRSTADAERAAGPGTTLLVTGTWHLQDTQVDRLVATGADLVVLDPDPWYVEQLTDGAVRSGDGSRAGVRAATCGDPDARAADRWSVTRPGGGFEAVDDRATVCFLAEDDVEAGAYAAVDVGRRVVLLEDATVLRNDSVTEQGAAALALRTLGRHEQLVWYVPSAFELDAEEAAPAPGDLLPTWAGPLTLQALVVVLLAALWRGRGLGRVVTEPLPVTVRAAETTLGRGRLYRRSRSRGHAAAALRAGTARRAAARLGLPRSAGAPEVIDAVARATRRPTDQVADLLYGPPPTDDGGLVELARRLDVLESEVHRT